MDGSQPTFQDVVTSLFRPEEPAYSLFYYSEKDFAGHIVDLRSITDPTILPQFWTLSRPVWHLALPELPWMDCAGMRTRKLAYEAPAPRWSPAAEIYDTLPQFDPVSPFLVFEIDYLLATADGGWDSTPGFDLKLLQRQAVAYALQASGFPFSVLVDSAGKSVHAYVRLSDPKEQVKAFREGEAFRVLQELCWTVFGHYDQGVMKQTGRVRLVRTPGAFRQGDPKLRQSILAVGRPSTISDLGGWFAGQCNPDVVAEIHRRGHAIAADAASRKWNLRLEKWRSDLVKPHLPGSRGTDWMFVSKSLAVAGCKQPRQVRAPQAPNDPGVWDAGFLWHVSVFVFNAFSKGWWFSAEPKEGERTRWWEQSDIESMVAEQQRFEHTAHGGGDLTSSWALRTQEDAERDPFGDEPLAAGPSSLPPAHQAPGVDPTGGLPHGQPSPTPHASTPPSPPGGSKKKAQLDYEFLAQGYVERFLQNKERQYGKKVSAKHGGEWRFFNGRFWEQRSEEAMLAQFHSFLPGSSHLEKDRKEALTVLGHSLLLDAPWQEAQNTVVFQNGTLVISDRDHTFLPDTFRPQDNVRSLMPHAYDPNATCPLWRQCLERFLPDPELRAIVQEMFGYTFMSGQPYQAFFMLLGSGANFKGTTLRVLEAIHGPENHEAVAIGRLAGRFDLFTLPTKRIAIDGDADVLGSALKSADGTAIVSTIKAWTGGDPMKIEKKNVQNESPAVIMNPKLILAANKRPRLVDPSYGVWRRLQLLPFDVTIQKHEIIPDFHKNLLVEIHGIINWAVQGVQRLLHQGKFTASMRVQQAIADYRKDMDNVLQFVSDFMQRDQNAGWHDVRPLYACYVEYAKELQSYPVGLVEFRQRLQQNGIECMQPPKHESIHGVPPGAQPVNGFHFWAYRGWRGLHPSAQLMTLTGAYPSVTPTLMRA